MHVQLGKREWCHSYYHNVHNVHINVINVMQPHVHHAMLATIYKVLVVYWLLHVQLGTWQTQWLGNVHNVGMELSMLQKSVMMGI